MTSALLARVSAGEPLASEHRQWLLETRDLVRLGMVASEVRQRVTGGTGTFVRVDDVALADAATTEPADEAGEVRISGAPALLDEAVAAVTALGARAAAPVTGFALHDLAVAAGPALRDWLMRLRESGLAAVAQARLDRLDEAWLEDVAAAGLVVQSVAPGHAVGDDAWAALLEQVAALQARHDVFQAFHPLPLESSVTEPSTGYDDMRAVATARVLLPSLPRLQVHWGRAGAKLAQACLLFGASDVDGVPARDPLPHGPRRAILEEVRRNIVAVGLTAVERTARFEPRTLDAGAPA